MREHLPGVLAAMREQPSGSLTQRLGAVVRYQVGPLAPADENVAAVPAWARLRMWWWLPMGQKSRWPRCGHCEMGMGGGTQSV